VRNFRLGHGPIGRVLSVLVKLTRRNGTCRGAPASARSSRGLLPCDDQRARSHRATRATSAPGTDARSPRVLMTGGPHLPGTCSQGSGPSRSPMLVAPDTNEDTNQAERHPQGPRFRAEEHGRDGKQDWAQCNGQQDFSPLAAHMEPFPALDRGDSKVQGNSVDQKRDKGSQGPAMVCSRALIDDAARAIDDDECRQHAND
jgi:hypothetical protein